MMMMILTYGQTQLTGVEAARMAFRIQLYIFLRYWNWIVINLRSQSFFYPDSYFVDGFNVIHIVHAVIIPPQRRERNHKISQVVLAD